MIYISPSLFEEPGGKDWIHRSVDIAIQLEMSVIPSYLYALYSIPSGTQQKVAALIGGIVREEMLHVVLGCNLLNALQGRPQLNRPETFLPYPKQIPGAVDPSPVLELSPLSKGLIERVFERIEAPENPKVNAQGPRTVGQFYRAIQAAITKCGEDLFKGSDPSLQIRTGIKGLIPVRDVKSACEAIDIIVDQGEGAPETQPPSADGFGHYYRFLEIKNGHEVRVTRDPEGNVRYVYDGPEIPFDECAILKVPSNPRTKDHPPNTPSRHCSDDFNYTYTGLVKVLDRVVNGEPGLLQEGLALMASLRIQAIGMMSGKASGGVPCGPTFEYRSSG